MVNFLDEQFVANLTTYAEKVAGLNQNKALSWQDAKIYMDSVHSQLPPIERDGFRMTYMPFGESSNNIVKLNVRIHQPNGKAIMTVLHVGADKLIGFGLGDMNKLDNLSESDLDTIDRMSELMIENVKKATF